MQDDIDSLRQAVLALNGAKRRRRYPVALRARLASFVRAHPERSVVSIAHEVDIAPQTLAWMVAASAAPLDTTPAALVPVRIVDDPVQNVAVRVRGPRGIIVEGLDVAGVAALIKALS